MTGFGQGRAEGAAGSAVVQVSTVNGRGLQISLRGDLRDPALEDEVRRKARDAVQRGSLSLLVQLRPHEGSGLDRVGLAGAWRELAALAQELGAPPPRLEEVAKIASGPGEAPAWGPAVHAACDAAFAALDQARRREGAALAEAFRALAARLRDLHGRLGAAAAERLPAWRQRLRERLREALADLHPATEEAILREAALQAERIDVAEELTRLAVHLDALDVLIARGGGETGRELDFLLQEIGREVNTTGSKANDPMVTSLVIEAKLIVDQLKEQTANVL